jgi:hypothetical protein
VVDDVLDGAAGLVVGALTVGVVEAGVLVEGVPVVGVEPAGATVPGWAPPVGVVAAGVEAEVLVVGGGVAVVGMVPCTRADAGIDIFRAGSVRTVLVAPAAAGKLAAIQHTAAANQGIRVCARAVRP